MIDFNKCWENRGEGCTCEPPVSSRPSVCNVHCMCYGYGISKYLPKIDGQCRRCLKYPLSLDNEWKD